MPSICEKCNEPTLDEETPVTCKFCNAHFHPACVEAIDGKIDDCLRCNSMIAANNKTDRLSQKSSEKSVAARSKASSKSSKLSKELELLEEKQTIAMDLIAQKEKLLEEKIALNKSYIEEKARIINEMEEISGIDKQSVTSTERGRANVSQWLESTTQTDQGKSKPNVTFSVQVPSETPPDAENNIAIPTVINNPNLAASNLDKFRRNSDVNKHSNVIRSQPTYDVNTALISTQPTTSKFGIQSEVSLISKEALAARKSDVRVLPSFDGTPRNWPTFYHQFQLSTSMCQFQDVDNIIRLRASLSGRALKAVHGALAHPENVSYIMQTLEQLFGKPEFIINELLKDVREFTQLKVEKFGDTVEFALLVRNMTTTMKGAGMSNHLWNPNLLHELIMKLPVQLQREWAQTQLKMPSFNIESFSQWLQIKAQECACLLSEPPTFGESRMKKGVVHLHDQVPAVPECCSCDGVCKEVSSCDAFNKMSYKERFYIVNTFKLCKKCLKKHKHPCLRKETCGIDSCPYKHHPLLHKYAEVHSVNTHHMKDSGPIFKIVPITLHHDGKSFSTFAMLDDGSSITLIESSVAKFMGVRGTRRSLCLQWTADTHRYEPDSEQLSMQVSGRNGKTLTLHNLHTVASLNLPIQSLDSVNLKNKYQHLQDIPFESYINAQPTVLIGLNNACLTLAHNTKMGSSDEPIAIKTQLGWVVFGNANCDERSRQEVYHICECQCTNSQIEDLIRDYIALDNLNVVRPKQDLLSKEDERSLAILRENTKYLGNRYETGLIWRYDSFKVPYTYGMALRRLKCLEKQMCKNPELRNQMQSQINEYINLQYIRELSNAEIEVKQHWYLPLFIVRNPNKPDKIRMVWDAAAKVDGVCLNSFLLKGPDQLVNLMGVLFRFRQFKVAIVGDIRHMFHQIRIREQDQQFLRFLWSDADGNIKVYVMEVMSFGPTCSPSSAQFVKNLNADQYITQFPRAVRTIKENHYVDDMLESVDTKEQANELVDQVKLIHKSGGFEIRNFLSNSVDVMVHCNEERRRFNDVVLPENNTEKVLGMWWNVQKDKFKYSLKFNKGNAEILNGSKVPTKREMLQVLMSVYDPLGLISHFLIYPKILMQQVWKSAIGWDDQISSELFTSWKKWIDSLQLIKKLKIPRWYGIFENLNDVELHVFVDASLEAYAAAAYLRDSSGPEVRCRLISAKCKVAPLKSLSVPRLELNAAVIGARLATHIKEHHSIKFKSTTFWTDSKTVWCWMKSETRMYKPYVSFRVAEILEVSSPQEWNWLPTDLNIADKATRQVIPHVSSRSEWFRGPKFLRKSSENWPQQPNRTESTTEELRLHVLLHSSQFPLQVTKFSKWNRLRRTMAYVNRFIHNMLVVKYKWQRIRGEITTDESSEAEKSALQVMLEKREGIFTSKEYQDAENEIFKIAQWEGFADEITAIKNNIAVDKGSVIRNCLPYIDENGVLRSKSRLDFMENTSEHFRRPIILPSCHHITILLMKYYHEKFWHQLHESAINELNQKFLIPSIKAAFKKMKSSCQKCKNSAAKPVVPLMGNLHKSRLQVFLRAFTFVGIDFFGPMNVAVGRQRQKRWGALITCLTTRGIHIEISHSLSTESCIMAIKRFMARRGEPREIYSDQGTNFKGASNELKKELSSLQGSELAERFVSSSTQWFFNPPGAPHMGGAWERLVRCVKNALYEALPTKTPSEEVLQTMMCQVEFVVNSRPLTSIPLENQDSEILTPNHFLFGSSNGSKPFCDIPNDKEYLLDSWKISNKFLGKYFQKFIKEYLPTIRRRTKDFDPMAKEVEVGDLVVIVDENFTKTNWKKGIVLDVFRSRDGHVRKATVQTQTGVFERAAAKLAVLDVKGKGNPDSSEPVELPGGSVAMPPANPGNSLQSDITI